MCDLIDHGSNGDTFHEGFGGDIYASIIDFLAYSICRHAISGIGMLGPAWLALHLRGSY